MHLLGEADQNYEFKASEEVELVFGKGEPFEQLSHLLPLEMELLFLPKI